jgi:FG-GAP repeat
MSQIAGQPFIEKAIVDGTLFQHVWIGGNTVVATGYDSPAYVFVEPSTGWVNATQTAILSASDNSLGFLTVSISGNTIVAGLPSATIGSNEGQGAAYVFVEPQGGWSNMVQTAKLTASDGAAGDALGLGVAVNGGTVVAGAPEASIGNSGNDYGQGAAYVFTEPSGGWTDMTETGKLTASDGASAASLGSSVAVGTGTIVTGAPYQYDTDGLAGGAAYVFAKPEGGWANGTETAKLSPSNPILDDAMGWSVSVNGKLIVAGSPGTLGFTTRQLAYEFLEPAGGWASRTQTTAVLPNKAPAYAEFGSSVSNNGTTVVIGAPGSVYTDYQGLAYVFAP